MKPETITLYHCTSNIHQESILTNGLLLNRGRSKTILGTKPIFLASSPQHCFGNTCFKVTIPKDWVTATINQWEFTCTQDIPAEFIEYHSYEEDE